MLFNVGNKLVNPVNIDSKLGQARTVLLCLSLGITLCACNNMITIPAPDTQPIHSPNSSVLHNSASEVNQPNSKTSNDNQDAP
ncbi:hypothetical protein [Psychrobacter pygoscelis]|uniref:hypothetical protein n=1 Tax=Psychrobacter pygoscelis TaxID=2488563 RepID=UPI00103BC376|nr:hypothetical protein [Psychrobacter pygoscelis]